MLVDYICLAVTVFSLLGQWLDQPAAVPSELPPFDDFALIIWPSLARGTWALDPPVIFTPPTHWFIDTVLIPPPVTSPSVTPPPVTLPSVTNDLVIVTGLADHEQAESNNHYPGSTTRDHSVERLIAEIRLLGMYHAQTNIALLQAIRNQRANNTAVVHENDNLVFFLCLFILLIDHILKTSRPSTITPAQDQPATPQESVTPLPPPFLSEVAQERQRATAADYDMPENSRSSSKCACSVSTLQDGIYDEGARAGADADRQPVSGPSNGTRIEGHSEDQGREPSQASSTVATPQAVPTNDSTLMEPMAQVDDDTTATDATVVAAFVRRDVDQRPAGRRHGGPGLFVQLETGINAEQLTAQILNNSFTLQPGQDPTSLHREAIRYSMGPAQFRHDFGSCAGWEG